MDVLHDSFLNFVFGVESVGCEVGYDISLVGVHENNASNEPDTLDGMETATVLNVAQEPTALDSKIYHKGQIKSSIKWVLEKFINRTISIYPK